MPKTSKKSSPQSKAAKTASKRPSARTKPAAAKVKASPRSKSSSTTAARRNNKQPKLPRQLPTAWRLTRQTVVLVWHYKALFGGVTLLYGILNLILVQGLA